MPQTFHTLNIAAVVILLALTPTAWADAGDTSLVSVDQIEQFQDDGRDIRGLIPDAEVAHVFDPRAGGLPEDAFADLPPRSDGRGNTSRVVQDGNLNLSVLRAVGSGNRTAQRQDGSNNRSRITVIGNDNAALTDQANDLNEAAITIDGSNHSAIAVFQDGGDAVNIRHSGAPKGLVIRQTN